MLCARHAAAARSQEGQERRGPPANFPLSKRPIRRSFARFRSHLISPALTYAPLAVADVLAWWPHGHKGHDNQNQEKQPMKLKIDTSAVSFICTRSPEQRIAFD